MLATALALLQAAPAVAPADFRIEYAAGAPSSTDVTLEIEVVAIPKSDRPSATTVKPRRVVRSLTWTAGGTDMEDLARVSAEALTSAGVDATAEGKAVLVRQATQVSIQSSGCASIHPQVSAAFPGGAPPAPIHLVLQRATGSFKGTLVLSASEKGSGPEPVDASAFGREPAPAPKEKGQEKPKKADPKAKAPKARTALKIDLAKAAEALAMREAIVKAGADAGWKVEPVGAALQVIKAGEGGAPRWVALAYAGEGDVKIGVQVPTAEGAPASGPGGRK
jgi:hypothetical protein